MKILEFKRSFKNLTQEILKKVGSPKKFTSYRTRHTMEETKSGKRGREKFYNRGQTLKRRGEQILRKRSLIG